MDDAITLSDHLAISKRLEASAQKCAVLNAAIGNNDLSSTKIILSDDFDSTMRNKHGKTPLRHADHLRKNTTDSTALGVLSDIIKSLHEHQQRQLSYFQDKTENFQCNYNLIKYKKYIERLKSEGLMNECLESGFSILHYAVKDCDLDLTKKLLEENFASNLVSIRNETPLDEALHRHRIEQDPVKKEQFLKIIELLKKRQQNS